MLGTFLERGLPEKSGTLYPILLSAAAQLIFLQTPPHAAIDLAVTLAQYDRQAKRYARDRSIGRPAMQAFVGALHGQQADRGVFMATCPFTREALDYADRVGARIIPIDGNELARLMLKHEVGVQPGFVATLMRLDEDFFESL